MKKFTNGQKLSTSSICNSECIFMGTVIKVSAKSLTVKVEGEVKRCKIHVRDDGVNFIYPHGRYSMAPTFRA